MIKRNALQLRRGEPPTPEEIASLKRNPIYIILDNVLDTYNVGAVFRLADATAVSKVLLCGETLTPPDHKIKKASVNTWQWVPWEYYHTTQEAITQLRNDVPGISVLAVELDERSIDYTKYAYTFPVALVVGHESDGISQEILELCDATVELPMYGVNISLNVMVSLGIALYEVVRHLPQK